ncbi:hypothetical protein SBADM41S_04035 [Streptomyces badius]
MVLEVTDLDALTGTALELIAAEYGEPVAGIGGGESAEERMHAEATVRADGAEALASLVDPFDLVSEVPGVELAQASWSSESIEYDPTRRAGTTRTTARRVSSCRGTRTTRRGTATRSRTMGRTTARTVTPRSGCDM